MMDVTHEVEMFCAIGREKRAAGTRLLDAYDAYARDVVALGLESDAIAQALGTSPFDLATWIEVARAPPFRKRVRALTRLRRRIDRLERAITREGRGPTV